MAELHFVTTNDNTQFVKSMNEVQSKFGQIEKEATTTGGSLNSLFSKIAGAAGMAAGAVSLKEIASQVVNVRGEFEQLEIAFGTMLGSTEKANKLMGQLTQTAARTPFDLKGIAQGAKQLLAYGTSADEVNDTLIGLGDIASGLSIPLNDLVMLYGTTMVQGRMFTQDLRQLQGRGIPIVDALAQHFGVAKEEIAQMVTDGKVKAADFQAALMSLSQEGGQFAGLMSKQSASLSGQISNIEDSIASMFNDIGKASQGAISAALSGVSAIVENYKSVGATILSLAGTYGTYKVAVVLVGAVERAHAKVLAQANIQKKLAAANNIQLANSDAMAAARKAIFTGSIKANTKALLKNSAAMLTNPAVLITAGVVALVAATVALTRALDTQARAQEAVNKLNDKRAQAIEDEQAKAKSLIDTIKDQTATEMQRAKAYEELSKLMPNLTKQFSQLDIAQQSSAKSQEELNKEAEKAQFDKLAKDIEETKRKLASAQRDYSTTTTTLAGVARASVQIKRQQAILADLQNQLADLTKAREEAAKASVKQEDADAKLNITLLRQQIIAQELAVKTAKANYAKSMTNANKQLVEDAESTLKSLTEKYDLASQTAWVSSSKLQDDITKSLQDAANERASILNNSIQDERAKREAEYWQEIKEIRQQAAEYKKANNGRSSSAFAKKEENATLKFNLDVASLDKQFAEWKKNFEQATAKISVDMELADLKQAEDLATSYADKLKAQNDLHEKQIALLKQEGELAKQKAIDDRFGAGTYTKYKTGATSDINASSLQEIATMEQEYDKQLSLSVASKTQEFHQQQLAQDIADFEQYWQEVLDIETERQEQLQAIRKGESGMSEEQVNSVADKKLTLSQASHGIDQTEEGIIKRQEQLIKAFATNSFDIIQQAAAKLDEEVKNQINTLNAELDSVRAEKEQNEQNISDTQAQISQTTDQETINALTERLNALLTKKTDLLTREQTLQGTINKTTTSNTKLQQQATNAEMQAGQSVMTSGQNQAKVLELVSGSFGSVKSAADAVSQTLGGALSKNGKKALETISGVADFGIQMCQNIGQVTQAVISAQTGAAEGMSKAMQAAETASMVLMIISMVVQAVMKIIEIAQKFSKQQQMQDDIDRLKDKIDDLNFKHEQMERHYKDKSGVEYYKGLARSAEAYNEVIVAQTQALNEAKNLYEYNASRYSDDSDKVKDAKKQYQDLQGDLNDTLDKQADAFQQLFDDLLTTDVQSFSESLADNLVEGFENGTEGIRDTWDDMLKDLMKSMLKKQLANALASLYAPIFDQMNARAKDGELTTQEIDQINQMLNNTQGQAEAIAQTYYNLMSERGLLDDADNEGSRGGFQSMSQDTADELNARFTALQIEGANVVVASQATNGYLLQMLQNDDARLGVLRSFQESLAVASVVAQQQLDQMLVVAENTGLLSETNRRLKSIEQNTERL